MSASKQHSELREQIVEGLMHERPSFTAGLEALDSLFEQLEAAHRALKQIVGMYEFEQVAADSWEDSGGHVGIARHDRAVLQGIGMARDIAVEALNPASEPVE